MCSGISCLHSGHFSHLFSVRTVDASTRIIPIENNEKVKHRAMKRFEAARYILKEAERRNQFQEYRFYAETEDDENSDEGIGSEVTENENDAAFSESEEANLEILVIC